MTKYYRLKDFNKVIWLNTKQADVIDADRKNYTFYLPNIELRDITKLRVNSIAQITGGGGGGGGGGTNLIYSFKIDGIIYNQNCYYNSDKRGNPTLLIGGFHSHQDYSNMINELILAPQTINSLRISIHNMADSAGPVAGVDFALSLVFDEMELQSYVEIKKELF